MNTSTFDDLTTAYEHHFAHYNDLARTLTDEQLTVTSLCPEWSVREVIAHVVGVEAVLDGWTPSVDSPPPFERMGAIQREFDGLDRDGMVRRVKEITTSRLNHLAEFGPAIVDAASITPVGKHTYGRFLQIRNFDMWVHARDIAIPLELDPPFPVGFPAENAVREVAEAAGYIVGKRIGIPDGMSIVFHLDGVDETIAVRVAGRAARVDNLGDPDVEVRADAQTFVMLAAGRIDPEPAIAAGRISWSGDETWGPVAVRNLAYTT